MPRIDSVIVFLQALFKFRSFMSSVIRETRLSNGMKILCLQKDEAQLMYQEVQNYLKYGIGLNQGDTVFDVGANIGLFALYLSDKFNQKINIYAFEPIPDIFEVLNKNIQRFRLKNVKSYACGLSQKAGNVKFTYYPNMTLGSSIRNHYQCK